MSKNYIKLAVILLFLSAFSNANEQQQKLNSVELLIYKTPTCGCCNKWQSHIQDAGLIAHSKDLHNIGSIKAKYGIRANYRSCHTAVSANGFAFEGHVPAKFIQQFLSQSQPNAIGLSVPAMPLGSPGMEVGDRFMPYQVLILFKDGTSQVYAEVKTYEEQF